MNSLSEMLASHRAPTPEPKPAMDLNHPAPKASPPSANGEKFGMDDLRPHLCRDCHEKIEKLSQEHGEPDPRESYA